MTSEEGQRPWGVFGPTSFTWEFSFLKKQCSKALWRMQRLVGNRGDEGSAKVSKGRRGGEGGARGEGGFQWKVWGLAQGCRQIYEWGLKRGGVWEGCKTKTVSANFLLIIFVFNYFSDFFSSYIFFLDLTVFFFYKK